jgi:spermidine synthase
VIQPLRYLLSFFREEVLEVSSSAYNTRLEVWYAWGKHVVNAANVNLSFGSLDKVFREAFRQIHLPKKPWKDVLLLGLGAGNVPAILDELPGPYHTTGVEIDGEMIRLAEKWCGLRQRKNLQVVQADAISFAKTCPQRFDLVIIDLFVDSLVPGEAEQGEFLSQCANLLRPGGMLMFNRLMHTSDLAEQSQKFTRRMQEILPGTRYITAHTNRMLLYEK